MALLQVCKKTGRVMVCISCEKMESIPVGSRCICTRFEDAYYERAWICPKCSQKKVAELLLGLVGDGG